MFDDLEVADDYCGFEQNDRDAWEDNQVFLDRELEMDREEVDEDYESNWDQAEADGFFASAFHDFE